MRCPVFTNTLVVDPAFPIAGPLQESSHLFVQAFLICLDFGEDLLFLWNQVQFLLIGPNHDRGFGPKRHDRFGN